MAACPSIEQLRRFLASELAEPIRGHVGRHVDGCAPCQRALDELTGDPRLSASGRDEGNAGDYSPVLTSLLAHLCADPPRVDEAVFETERGSECDPRAPLSLLDFELLERIGEGGMGAVYSAIQRSLNKPVAIKLLRVDTNDPGAIERFLAEACAAASLRHPNIVDVHGIGRTRQGGYFLVMDLVAGTDLEQKVRTGNLGDIDPAEIVATVAEAIHHAHIQGIVHRDLKPSNVLLSTAGQVLVTDFGVAKVLGAEAITASRQGLAIGTPNYMAPEQADPRRGDVGPATDVYGLGGILYYLMTGQHPYPRGEGGDLGVLAQVLSADSPIRPSVLRSGVIKELEWVCMKCLEKRPADRYQSAAEVADSLRSLGELAVSEGAGAKDTWEIEPPQGAVPLDSQFYLVREADATYQAALARGDSIVLVRGARQMGKTSLIARGLKHARDAGSRVVLTDLQKLSLSDLQTPESLFLALGEWLSEKLELDAAPHDSWNPRRGASVNFERFLRREVLTRLQAPLVWGLDEVDRLFPCPYASEVFGLFRSWHNERALDPGGPFSRLTLAMAYATEAHLFITDINQSPFNVGTRINLADFTRAQVVELNDRYRAPLHSDAEVGQFMDLVGGQPYLVNRGLYELRQQHWDLGQFIDHACGDQGVFGDHLRRIIVLLAQDDALREALGNVVRGDHRLSLGDFYRLRSAGILAGESTADCTLRCGLYRRYFEERL